MSDHESILNYNDESQNHVGEVVVSIKGNKLYITASVNLVTAPKEVLMRFRKALIEFGYQVPPKKLYS